MIRCMKYRIDTLKLKISCKCYYHLFRDSHSRYCRQKNLRILSDLGIFGSLLKLKWVPSLLNKWLEIHETNYICRILKLITKPEMCSALQNKFQQFMQLTVFFLFHIIIKVVWMIIFKLNTGTISITGQIH